MNVPSGYTALDMVGFTDQGVYNSATAYVKNDIVHYNGNLWRCLVDDTTAVTPTEGANWTVFLAEPTSAAEDIIAPVEATATSTRIYSVGDQLILGDVLYDVKQAINIGDTLTVGTNIAAADTIVKQLAEKADSADLAAVATSGEYSDLDNLPTLGTAAAKNVPESGDASNTEVVMGNDTRLTNARNAADVPAWAKAPNKPTYNGSEIATSTAESGTDQQSISDTIASGTSMDGAVGTLLNNDKTLDTNVTSLKETLSNQIGTGSKNLFDSLNMDIRPSSSGITTTRNSDGSITITSGTVSGEWYYPNNTYKTLKLDIPYKPNTQYVFSVGDNTVSKLQVFVIAGTFYKLAEALNAKTLTFTTPASFTDIYIRLDIPGGGTISQATTYYPMVCEKSIYDIDPSYVPYAATNQQLTGLISNDFTNGAVNLLPNKATSRVVSGITYTVNDDGTILVNGTASGSGGLSNLSIKTMTFKKGQYKISGTPSGGNYNTGYALYIANSSTQNTVATDAPNTSGFSDTFTVTDESTSYIITILVRNGATVSNALFKPMITVADMPNSDYNHYVPYAMTNRELTENIKNIKNPALLYGKSEYFNNAGETFTFSVTDDNQFVLLFVCPWPYPEKAGMYIVALTTGTGSITTIKAAEDATVSIDKRTLTVTTGKMYTTVNAMILSRG